MADQRLGDPVVPEALDDFGHPDDTSGDAPRTRRALLISLAALLVLGAAAVPIALHFVHRTAPGLHTPAHIAGLNLDTSADAKNTAEYVRAGIAAALNLQTSVGAVYIDGSASAQADAHSVIFVGGTAKGSDATLLNQIMSQLNDSTDGVSALTTEDPGKLGGLMKCGLTTDTSKQDAGTDDEMAVCGFAGNGQVGLGLFANRTTSQAATLMGEIRTAVQ